MYESNVSTDDDSVRTLVHHEAKSRTVTKDDAPQVEEGAKSQRIKQQQMEMQEIHKKTKESLKPKEQKKQSKRTQAFQKLLKQDIQAEVTTTQKLFERKTVLDKMDASTQGPLSVLHTCMEQGLKAQVWVRKYKGLRGCLTGYIAAFDHHMNLALIDVDEVYTIETWMMGKPLKKYQKRVLKKREEKRLQRQFKTSNESEVSCTEQKDMKVENESVQDYLKKLTQSIKRDPMKTNADVIDKMLENETRVEKNNTESINEEDKVVSADEPNSAKSIDESREEKPVIVTDEIWSFLSKIDLSLLNKNSPNNEQKTIGENQESIMKNNNITSTNLSNDVSDSSSRKQLPESRAQFHSKYHKRRLDKIPISLNTTSIVDELKNSGYDFNPKNSDPRLRPRELLSSTSRTTLKKRSCTASKTIQDPRLRNKSIDHRTEHDQKRKTRPESKPDVSTTRTASFSERNLTGNNSREEVVDCLQQKKQSLTLNKLHDKRQLPNVDELNDKKQSLSVDESQNKKQSLSVDESRNKKQSLSVDELYDKKQPPNVDELHDKQSLSVDESHDKKQPSSVDKLHDKNQSLNVDKLHDKNQSLDVDKLHDKNQSLSVDESHDKKQPLSADKLHDKNQSLNVDKLHDKNQSLSVDKLHDKNPSLNVDKLHDKNQSFSVDELHDKKQPPSVDESHDKRQAYDVDKLHDNKQPPTADEFHDKRQPLNVDELHGKKQPPNIDELHDNKQLPIIDKLHDKRQAYDVNKLHDKQQPRNVDELYDKKQPPNTDELDDNKQAPNVDELNDTTQSTNLDDLQDTKESPIVDTLPRKNIVEYDKCNVIQIDSSKKKRKKDKKQKKIKRLSSDAIENILNTVHVKANQGDADEKPCLKENSFFDTPIQKHVDDHRTIHQQFSFKTYLKKTDIREVSPQKQLPDGNQNLKAENNEDDVRDSTPNELLEDSTPNELLEDSTPNELLEDSTPNELLEDSLDIYSDIKFSTIESKFETLDGNLNLTGEFHRSSSLFLSTSEPKREIENFEEEMDIEQTSPNSKSIKETPKYSKFNEQTSQISKNIEETPKHSINNEETFQISKNIEEKPKHSKNNEEALKHPESNEETPKHSKNDEETRRRHPKNNEEKPKHFKNYEEKPKHSKNNEETPRHPKSNEETSQHPKNIEETPKHSINNEETSQISKNIEEKPKHSKNNEEALKHPESNEETPKHSKNDEETRRRHPKNNEEKPKHFKNYEETPKHSKNTEEKPKHPKNNEETPRHPKSNEETSKHPKNIEETPEHSKNIEQTLKDLASVNMEKLGSVAEKEVDSDTKREIILTNKERTNQQHDEIAETDKGLVKLKENRKNNPPNNGKAEKSACIGKSVERSSREEKLVERSSRDEESVGRSLRDQKLFGRSSHDEKSVGRSSRGEKYFRKSSRDDKSISIGGKSRDEKLDERSSVEEKSVARSSRNEKFFGRSSRDEKVFGRSSRDEESAERSSRNEKSVKIRSRDEKFFGRSSRDEKVSGRSSRYEESAERSSRNEKSSKRRSRDEKFELIGKSSRDEIYIERYSRDESSVDRGSRDEKSINTFSRSSHSHKQKTKQREWKPAYEQEKLEIKNNLKQFSNNRDHNEEQEVKAKQDHVVKAVYRKGKGGDVDVEEKKNNFKEKLDLKEKYAKVQQKQFVDKFGMNIGEEKENRRKIEMSETEESNKKHEMIEVKNDYEKTIEGDFDLKKELEVMKSCVDKVYTDTTGEQTLRSDSDEDEDEDDEKGLSTCTKLNVFQQRKQKSNEIFIKTRVKRTYGWLEKNDKENNEASKKTERKIGKKKEKRESFTLTIDSGDKQLADEKKVDGKQSVHKKLDEEEEVEDEFIEERMKWIAEMKRRRQRELIKQIRGVDFTPNVEGTMTTKGLVYRRRHLNQLFVRGDNIVLVAYDKPNSKQLNHFHCPVTS